MVRLDAPGCSMCLCGGQSDSFNRTPRWYHAQPALLALLAFTRSLDCLEPPKGYCRAASRKQRTHEQRPSHPAGIRLGHFPHEGEHGSGDVQCPRDGAESRCHERNHLHGREDGRDSLLRSLMSFRWSCACWYSSLARTLDVVVSHEEQHCTSLHEVDHSLGSEGYLVAICTAKGDE